MESLFLHSNMEKQRLNGETLAVFDVSEKKEPSCNSNSFTSNLPMDKCCLLFTHFDYLSVTDGVERSKFVNLLWSSPHSPPAFHFYFDLSTPFYYFFPILQS